MTEYDRTCTHTDIVLPSYHPELRGDTAPMVKVLYSSSKKQSMFFVGMT